MADLIMAASADPASAHAAAAAVLATAPDPCERVRTLRAMALACKELGQLAEGFGHLRQARAIAEENGLGHAAAQVKMTEVGLLIASGDLSPALRAAAEAEPALGGPDLGRLLANVAQAHARQGHMSDVLKPARRAIGHLRHGDDAAALAGALTNRGLAEAYLGHLSRGDRDLRRAITVAERSGLRHLALLAQHNRAFIAMRRGDLAHALVLYDELEPAFGPAGERHLQFRLDKAETLIAARLPGEARGILGPALADAMSRGYGAEAGDGLLLLAHAELADGHAELALRSAHRAGQTFHTQARPGMALLAEHAGLRARWASGAANATAIGPAIRLSDQLERGGWTDTAADARVIAALAAIRAGRTHQADAIVAGLERARDVGPVGVRVAIWHATALSRLTRGDERGAAAAVRSGLHAVHQHANGCGATELRLHSAAWAADLGLLGIRLARRPRALLVAAERWRETARRPPPVLAPRDTRLAGQLAALRRLDAELAGTIASGGDIGRLRHARTRLETSVRAQARNVLANSPAPVALPGAGTADRLARTLGDRAFVELIASGDELLAVSVARGRCRRWHLGELRQAEDEAHLLRFTVNRLLGSGGADRVAEATLTASAERLDAQLFEPLRAVIADRELVFAPAGDLQGVPWAILPSLASRPTTLVPSGTAWLRAASRPAGTTTGRVLLVAGPGLRRADEEINALTAIYPGASVLTSAASHTDDVRRALEVADTVHIAAHGSYRGDNPLFSSLRLADGPLMAYDLEGLRGIPRLVVLAACEAGRSGEAIMGLADLLLSFGTASVIASVAPVCDDATRDFMIDFHKRRTSGLTPAQALAACPREPGVLGFCCFGT